MSITSGPTEPCRTGKSWFLPPMPRLAWSSAITLSFTIHPLGDAGEAFLPPEQHQHIENPGRGGPPGQRRPERLGDLAQLDLRRLGDAAHRRLCGLGAPFVKRRQDRINTGEQPRRVARKELLRLLVEIERAGLEQEGGAVGQLAQVARARLE